MASRRQSTVSTIAREPPFRIELDQPDGVFAYTAGDTISGRVVLESKDDEAVGRVVIEFWGRSKTKIVVRRGEHRHVYRGRADLFRYDETLYAGKYKLRADKYEWPFRFTFPSVTSRTDNVAVWTELKRRDYEYSPGFPLPPSFRMGALRFFGQNCEAYVEYKLEARLDRPSESGSVFNRSLTSERMLTFVLPSIPESELPEHLPFCSTEAFQFRSYLLDDSRDGAPLTFKEKYQTVLRSDSVPCAWFTVDISTVRTIHLGEPLVITLRLKPLPERSTASTQPKVLLKGILATLKGITDSRTIPGGGIFSAEHFDHDETDIASRVRIPEQEFAKINDYEVTAIIGAFTSEEVQPNFKTYNIHRRYRLKLKMAFGCVDKTVNVDRIFDVSVLPPKARGGFYVVQEMAMPSVSGRPLGRYDVEDLPSYREAIKA